MAKESDASAPAAAREPVIRLRDAELRFGPRVLWHDLDLDVAPGEFLAVLGPNGTGKTSLLKVLLGQNSLSAGTAEVGGRQVHKGNPDIGYIPQQRGIDPHTPMRGRDLVRMGIDGHRWGMGLLSRVFDIDRGDPTGEQARPDRHQQLLCGDGRFACLVHSQSLPSADRPTK